MRRALTALMLLISALVRLLGLAPEILETKPAPEDRVAQIVERMTLEEKLLQLFIVTPEALTGENTVTDAEKLSSALADTPVGGIVLFQKNLVSSDQTRALTGEAQDAAEYGLFVAVDEEGGTVARLMNALGTRRLGPMYDYRAEGPDRARENAAVIGEDIRSYGFNLDFAPVADVWTNSGNTVIGRRAYSDDPEEAAELVAAAVEGFHDTGAMCTLKHFPGHGDTTADSHTGAAVVELSREEIEKLQFPPFASGIDAGADMVMVGHLTCPALDDEIATVSRGIVTEILRGELGFEGVVITDSLQMSAASKEYSPGQLAVRAIDAGVDILLMPEDLREALDALNAAVDSGELTEERINESVKRIITLKLRYGLLE